MSAKTKIVVLQMKEVIYTGIFVILGVLFILLFIFMFLPKEKETPDVFDSSSRYVAGVYSSSISFNNQCLNVEVVVDEDHINGVHLVNLNETVTTMYPLFSSVLDDINDQLLSSQSIDKVTYSQEAKYTSQVLLEAIRLALEKASP